MVVSGLSFLRCLIQLYVFYVLQNFHSEYHFKFSSLFLYYKPELFPA